MRVLVWRRQMATPPSLEEVLSQHGLKMKDLESVCPRDVRNKVAVELADWKMVGHCFNFSRSKLAAIDRENQTEDQRKVVLLDAWGEREGEGASYLKLAEILHQRERRDLVEMLCELRKSIIPSGHAITASMETKEEIESGPVRVNNTTERIQMLERQFDNLHQQLMSEITEDETFSGLDLLRALTMLPVSVRKEYESSVQQMLPTLDIKASITELFLRLGPLFVFIDYGLLDHLISKFGSMKLQEEMKLYVSEIQVFMQETTVADLMDYWPGEEQPHLNYSKLRAKFGCDPKTYTLERLNNYRRKFCSKVRLSEFIFGLILLEAGESFFATWLVPTIVAPELKIAASKIEKMFYEEDNVLMISLDQEVLYQSVTVSKNSMEDLVMVLTLTTDTPEVQEEISHHVALLGDQLKSAIPSITPSPMNDHTEQMNDLIKSTATCDEKEIVRLKGVVDEKDLEIQLLKAKLGEAYNKDREKMQDLVLLLLLLCELYSSRRAR